MRRSYSLAPMLLIAALTALLPTLVFAAGQTTQPVRPATAPAATAETLALMDQMRKSFQTADAVQLTKVIGFCKQALTASEATTDSQIMVLRDHIKDLYIAALEAKLAQTAESKAAGGNTARAVARPEDDFDRFAGRFVKIANDTSGGTIGSNARYDVRRSDSLVYPIQGTLACRPEDTSGLHNVWLFRFGLKDGHWEMLAVQIGSEDESGRLSRVRALDTGMFAGEARRANDAE